MRIGIDATCWFNRRGFGRFAHELLRALARLETDDAYVLFADRQTAHGAAFLPGWRAAIARRRTDVALRERLGREGRAAYEAEFTETPDLPLLAGRPVVFAQKA